MRVGIWIIGVLGLVLVLSQAFPYAMRDDSDEKFRLFYLTLLLLMVGGSSYALRRDALSQTIKQALIWLAIILGLVFGYSQRHILLDNDLAAELMPNRPRVSDGGTVSVRAAEDGHFHIEGTVNGEPVLFMVDTGASDIVLAPRDAARAGYEVETLNYTRATQTANGTGSGAPVRIERLEIGTIEVENIQAMVNGADMDQSLLGMEFLRQLKSYSVEGDTLVLVP